MQLQLICTDNCPSLYNKGCFASVNLRVGCVHGGNMRRQQSQDLTRVLYNELDTILIGTGLAPGAAGIAPHHVFRITSPNVEVTAMNYAGPSKSDHSNRTDTGGEPRPTVATNLLLLAMPGLVPFLLAIFFVSILRLSFVGYSEWYLRIVGSLTFIVSMIIVISGMMQMTIRNGELRGAIIIGIGILNFIATFATMVVGLALYQAIFDPATTVSPDSYLVGHYREAVKDIIVSMGIVIPEWTAHATTVAAGSVLTSGLMSFGSKILTTEVG